MLLSKETIENITGIDQEDIPEDLLRWAESEVEGITGKIYTLKTYTTGDFYLPEDQEYINLKHRNIQTVSCFLYDDELLDSTDYYLYKDSGIINYTVDNNTKINITYTYGNQQPEDLEKHLCFLLFLKKVMLIKPSLLTKEIISESIGDYSVSYNTSKLAQSIEDLDKEIDKIKRQISTFFELF